MTASCIYKGWVSHQRYQPKPHGFKYQVFMMLLDLDELPALFTSFRFWSFEHSNIASFNRQDYWGDQTTPLKTCIQQLVKQKTGKTLNGPIRLLTNMRYFGHCFNPVSFYYCYESDGKTLSAIVSHITNTPWDEDYAYVHDFANKPNQQVAHFTFDKAFHVSPFMPMDIAYDWAFKQDDAQIVIHMKNLKAGEVVFNATLHLQPEPISQKSLNCVLLHYPFMTLKVVWGIYWNALLLKLKGIPFYSHPDKNIKHTMDTASQNETLTKALKSKSRSKWVANFAKQKIHQQLAKLKHGQLTLIEENDTQVFGEPGGIDVTMTIHDAKFYGEMAFGGSIGAGEAYMLGYWQASNLTDVIRLMVLNQDIVDSLENGYQWLSKPFMKLLHWLNSNTKEGSKKNIAAHYDLGNDLFKLFLDERMMYSSAMFDAQHTSLDDGATLKLKTICDKLDLQASDRVIEIGTGWGGFAIYAASNYGCHVTTTTISQAQYDEAETRIAALGLQDKITLLLEDYRALTGTYDKLVSIEMVEAVGHQFYDIYFAKVSSLLKPDGLALIQAITIADQRYAAAIQSVDFIQRYIFPGSNIPSNTAMQNSITKVTDLRVFDIEDIGPDYATTLALWRERFFANIEQVKALGYSQAFINMWAFYLCYCEGGFAERALGDVHLLLAKPHNRRPALYHD